MKRGEVWRMSIADAGEHNCVILTRDDIENSVTVAVITHSRPRVVEYPILAVVTDLPSIAGICDGYIPCDALLSRLRRFCDDALYVATLSDTDLVTIEDAVRWALYL
jgi:mRNA-degrading endonuclease toxin of MazEF toxin-antitoxin module